MNNVDPTGYWEIPIKSLRTLFVIIGLNPIAAILIAIDMIIPDGIPSSEFEFLFFSAAEKARKQWSFRAFFILKQARYPYSTSYNECFE